MTDPTPPASANADQELHPPGWGFRVTVPPGWTHGINESGAVFGHDQIAGMVVLITHAMRSQDEIREAMARGYAAEGLWLEPATEMEARDEHTLVGRSRGVAGVEETSAHVIGITSPRGGAVVMALATPAAFSDALILAADALAQSIVFDEAPSAEIHADAGAVGVWATKESQLSGGAESASFMAVFQWITLLPDGTVAWQKAEAAQSSYYSRTHEIFEDYRSGRLSTGDAGHYRLEGSRIAIHWSGEWQGQVSEGWIETGGGEMTLSNLGVLDRGASLRLTRYRS